MAESPSWLPEIVPTSGDWNETLENLYRIFETDFINGNLTFRGFPVWWDRKVEPGGKFHEGFWHLISCTNNESRAREPDFRRAERLSWCGAILRNCADPAVKNWNYKEGNGKVRTYVWLDSYDYVIILEKKIRPRYSVYFLVTAFYVDGDSKRRDLGRKYLNRCA